MYTLLAHQWKEKIRSSFWQKNIVLNILLGILGTYFLLNIVVVSLFLDKILLLYFKTTDVVTLLTQFLFYFFLVDLFVRFLFQQVPSLAIQPYLTLPIPKSKLLHYPLIKSIFSFLNLFSLLLILPFFIKNIFFTQHFQFSFSWLVCVLSIVGTNNFILFLLKKYFSKQLAIPLFLFASIALVLALEFTKTTSFSISFSESIYWISSSYLRLITPLTMLALAYFSAYTMLRKNAYIEDTHIQNNIKSTGFDFLNNYGQIGQLLGIELKMILRNKRPRSLLVISLLFILYGFMFYKKGTLDNVLIMSISGLMLPAMFAISYGQFMFSWDSSYFDSLLTQKITFFEYIKSKQIFLIIACILGFVVSLPFAFIDYSIAFINAAFLLYNIGISITIMLFLGTFNTRYIDLGKGQFMNYEGTGFTQFLVMLPIFGIPFLIYVLFDYLGITPLYYYSIALFGVIGIVLNKIMLVKITKEFKKRRYTMALGFRKK